MTVYRRIFCLAAALCLMITLIPSATGTMTDARADSTRFGITLDKVNARYGPSTGEKIAFKLEASTVCEIVETKVNGNITWFKVLARDPERPLNNNTYPVYVHGDFFRELTADEIAQYNASGTVGTPTPVPNTNGGDPTPTPTPQPSGKNIDLPAIEGSIGSVTAGGTNFREGPGTGYHSIERLDRNTQVELLTIPSLRGAGSGTFFKVKYNGQVGYIMSDFISILSGGPANGESTVVTPTPTPAAADITPTPVPEGILGYVKTKVGGCNLRATISGTVIKTIKKNVVLPYILPPMKKNGYTWYYVVDGENKGYLRGDVVTEVKNPGETPTPTPTSTPAPGATDTPTPVPGTDNTPTPTPEATADPATGYVKTTSSGINLRQKAGYTDVIGRVDKNVVMPYYGQPTKVKGVTWYYVEHKTLGKGWLHADYLTLCNADGSPVVTPTPEPTATPEPGTTPAPGGSGAQEASYTTLKTGSTGTAVKNLVTELKNQGFYSGTVTNKYTTAVADAVKAFQKAKGLSVDGVAGAATQHKLFGTVPIGAGDTSNLTMTLYPAEKIDWYTGGINELWARGSNYKVYDVKTGIVWWAHRWAGGLHVDAEPLTAADTARLCKCYGVTTSQEIASKNLYERRPLLVTIGTRTFACSLYGVPHNYPEGDTISTNEFKGQVCIHFSNSKTHNSNKVDSGHEEAIEYAWEHAPNGHK